jgi:hypothetical protein
MVAPQEAPKDPRPRVRLLVSILAWRYRDLSPGNMRGGLDRSCRFLSPSEPLYRAGPGRVADETGAVWMCGDSYLTEDAGKE